MARKDWGYTPCILKVKKLNIKNEGVKNIDVEWKFNKETGELFIQVVPGGDMTFGSSETNINQALRDYGKWYA